MSLIIDLHKEFLKGAHVILLKVREQDIRFMQSFIIGMIVRDIYTRNTNQYSSQAEALARTKEELQFLCESVGLELGDVEKFLADFTKTIM